MNILAINTLWALGVTVALFWRFNALLTITDTRPSWANPLQWALVLTVFKQMMALFFYSAETPWAAEVFYILVVLPTAVFIPMVFQTVLHFVARPAGPLVRLGAIGMIVTVTGVCFTGIEGMVLRQPWGLDGFVFDAQLAPWAGALLGPWVLVYGVATFLVLRPLRAPERRALLPVVCGYGIYLLLLGHDSQVATGVLKTPFLGGFGDVILSVSFVMSAELKLTEQLRRMAAHDRDTQADLAARQQVLDGVGAELHVPMQQIDTLRQTLEDLPLETEAQRLVSLIGSASGRLQKTLTELVDFERLSRGELILSNEEILLSDLLREVLQEGERLTGVAQLDFIADVDIAEGLIVQGDRQRLRQVLVSLIANAAKFTPEGSVLFRARAYGSTGSSQLTLRFEVADTGVGIAAHNQERIFHAFAQADEGLQRRFEGAGLGLALAGELVRKMKGHIQLDSKVAQGTRVRVDLTMNQLAREGSHSVGPAG